MSTFGDVVYCKDCDFAREAAAEGAVVGSGSPSVERPPRRMANKKDANGDPLCTACLDARVEKRRAAFLLHEGRAPLPPPRLVWAAEPVKRVEIEFLPRRRDAVAPPKSDPAPSRRAGKVSPQSKRSPRGPSISLPARASKQEVRAKERRFAMLAAEIGFLRAKQLLGALMTVGRR
jgi:hypothetical protein